MRMRTNILCLPQSDNCLNQFLQFSRRLNICKEILHSKLGKVMQSAVDLSEVKMLNNMTSTDTCR